MINVRQQIAVFLCMRSGSSGLFKTKRAGDISKTTIATHAGVVIPITTDFARMRLNISAERSPLKALSKDKILHVFSYTAKCKFFSHGQIFFIFGCLIERFKLMKNQKKNYGVTDHVKRYLFTDEFTWGKIWNIFFVTNYGQIQLYYTNASKSHLHQVSIHKRVQVITNLTEIDGTIYDVIERNLMIGDPHFDFKILKFSL